MDLSFNRDQMSHFLIVRMPLREVNKSRAHKINSPLITLPALKLSDVARSRTVRPTSSTNACNKHAFTKVRMDLPQELAWECSYMVPRRVGCGGRASHKKTLAIILSPFTTHFPLSILLPTALIPAQLTKPRKKCKFTKLVNAVGEVLCPDESLSHVTATSSETVRRKAVVGAELLGCQGLSRWWRRWSKVGTHA
jgi:hypothetical protein